MISRTYVLSAPLAEVAAGAASRAVAATGNMALCMHQGTSRGAGYRKSLEGWAKAGSRTLNCRIAFSTTSSRQTTCRPRDRVFKDLGLPRFRARLFSRCLDSRPCADRVARNVEKTLRSVFLARRAEGLSPFRDATRKVTMDDYKATPGCIREAGEIAEQYNITGMSKSESPEPRLTWPP